MAGQERVLYIGTVNGLYAAQAEGTRYEARLLGLQGKGPVTPLVDRADPQRLYAGTGRAGMYRSLDGGRTWQEINEGIIYKEIWSLAQHPVTGELYAGTGPSSVFKSIDGGDTWLDCEQLRTLPETKEWTFPNPPHISHVKHLALRADDPAFILGAVEEGWIIRSTDGGATWQNVKDGVDFDSHSVTIMPDNPAVVIATGGEGLFRSTDGGLHFAAVEEGLDRRYLAQVVVHPARPRVLFTAAAAVPPPLWRRPEGADGAFYRSEDQGQSWTHLTGGLPAHLYAAPRALAGDPADPDAVFVGMSDGTVWLSEDGGESFRPILDGLPAVRSLCVASR
jgi:photosystem II stability/assembly factor-like uncharacterized protein